MKLIDVAIARVYLTEGEHRVKPLLQRLHDEERVRGVTVFRGIEGFGRSGRIHAASLLDLSLDLPVVVEFFDAPDRMEQILAHLDDLIEGGHVVTWPARMNDGP